MNLHQVLTGAVNPGDNCFSVGSVNNVPFTAYASGCDVVILGSDFERLQIIPGAKHGNIQVGCVDCSLRGGQVRAEERYSVPLCPEATLVYSRKCLCIQKYFCFFFVNYSFNLFLFHLISLITRRKKRICKTSTEITPTFSH
uniref:Uncharacterized protein n=1 Tax=Sphaeramia orbicularis TaxID=375764 RepID=A0A672YUD7_9TELE